MDSRMKQMDSLLGLGLNDIRMLGVCGMGGIGKTTIAKLVFDKICYKFDGSCFLSDVRENCKRQSLVTLQRKLLSEILRETKINTWDDHTVSNEIRRRLQHKRVLVILDDVDTLKQLQGLAGMPDWFDLGSRIIVTTRDQRLLLTHGVNYVYMVEALNHDEALELFCHKAFRNSYFTNEYLDLSLNIVTYADGLPLALEVLGSFLFGRSKYEWKDALNRLKRVPDERIFEILKISYDGLQELEKKIFLDIACFFEGSDKDEVTELLDSCDFYPYIGISVLIDKCMLSLSNNILRMHELIKYMGKEIVRQECPEKPGQRSRLWDPDDIHRVLTKNEGTESVEGIILDFHAYEGLKLNAKSFYWMKSLRLLKIKDVSLSQYLQYLSDELRLLNWHGYPLRYLPANFQHNKLFELNICYSRIKQLWNGIKHMDQLKIIILSHSTYFTKTPDFTRVPNLERLVLDGCTSLSFVHPSIGLLKKLKVLNLKGCSKLRKLPEDFGHATSLKNLDLSGTALKEIPSIQHLTRLEVLNLNGCSKLEKLPEELGNAISLKNLDLSGTAIGQLPPFISVLKNLEQLYLQGCKGQPRKSWNPLSLFLRFQRENPSDLVGLRLPSLSGLFSLKLLNLSDCDLQEGVIPSDLGCLPSLESLDLSRNHFVSLPASLSRLPKLESLNINYCRQLQVLPELPATTSILFADYCTSLEVISISPSSVFKRAPIFYLSNCVKLPGDQGNNRVIIAFFKNVVQSLLRGQLQICMLDNIIYSEFDIFISGSRVPEWFHYKSIGSLASIWTPIDVGGNTFKGLALCAALSSHHIESIHNRSASLECSLEVGTSTYKVTTSFPIKFMAESDHLWMSYVSQSYLARSFLPEDHTSIRAHFGVDGGQGMKVKACGIHPVFDPDLEEFIRASSNPSSSTRFEELNDDSLAVTSTNIKRSRDYFCPDQQPYPKRLR